MSTKKKAGERSGNASWNCRRRLPSICTTITSTARPRPSESTTDVVSAPGRWIFATASRSAVIFERGSLAASRMINQAITYRTRKVAADATTKNVAIRLS